MGQEGLGSTPMTRIHLVKERGKVSSSLRTLFSGDDNTQSFVMGVVNI